MRTIKGFLVNEDKAEMVEIEEKLQSYYDVLNCDCIDVAVREIDGKEFDIICDDEGLFKQDQIVTAVNEAMQPQLVGAILVVQHDGQGDFQSLTDGEVEIVSNRVVQYIDMAKGKIRPVLVLDN